MLARLGNVLYWAGYGLAVMPWLVASHSWSLSSYRMIRRPS
jgi:hypothetical protein